MVHLSQPSVVSPASPHADLGSDEMVWFFTGSGVWLDDGENFMYIHTDI